MTRGGLRKEDILKKKIKKTVDGKKVIVHRYVPKSKSRPTKKSSKIHMEENKTTLAYWRAAVKAVNKGKLPVPFPKKGSPLHKKAKAEFRKYMNGTRKPKKSKK